MPEDGTDIFSLDRTRRPSSPPSGTPPFFPYALAWKEFDKLHKTVHHAGPFFWVRTAMEFVMFGATIIGLQLARRSNLIVTLAFLAVAAAELFFWFYSRNRFLRWQCPRCHSEWPGTKNEKDRACRACGLRLHQLSP